MCVCAHVCVYLCRTTLTASVWVVWASRQQEPVEVAAPTCCCPSWPCSPSPALQPPSHRHRPSWWSSGRCCQHVIFYIWAVIIKASVDCVSTAGRSQGSTSPSLWGFSTWCSGCLVSPQVTTNIFNSGYHVQPWVKQGHLQKWWLVGNEANQSIVNLCVAFLPGPVLYGTVIDSTCITWGRKCGQKTSCHYYNLDKFRQRWAWPAVQLFLMSQ